eukprot:TRINITY_DN25935_c0_g1_i2.p1 TRINITY_DN25935_c0_g1~~TRINITY_DN25935_c0_g1_i2.p1  ORF type:complete len:787 (-),score=126.78 TRINITY_DN25935_c0_g1_i2:131-2491(-)
MAMQYLQGLLERTGAERHEKDGIRKPLPMGSFSGPDTPIKKSAYRQPLGDVASEGSVAAPRQFSPLGLAGRDRSPQRGPGARFEGCSPGRMNRRPPPIQPDDGLARSLTWPPPGEANAPAVSSTAVPGPATVPQQPTAPGQQPAAAPAFPQRLPSPTGPFAAPVPLPASQASPGGLPLPWLPFGQAQAPRSPAMSPTRASSPPGLFRGLGPPPGSPRNLFGQGGAPAPLAGLAQLPRQVSPATSPRSTIRPASPPPARQVAAPSAAMAASFQRLPPPTQSPSASLSWSLTAPPVRPAAAAAGGSPKAALSPRNGRQLVRLQQAASWHAPEAPKAPASAPATAVVPVAPAPPALPTAVTTVVPAAVAAPMAALPSVVPPVLPSAVPSVVPSALPSAVPAPLAAQPASILVPPVRHSESVIVAPAIVPAPVVTPPVPLSLAVTPQRPVLQPAAVAGTVTPPPAGASVVVTPAKDASPGELSAVPLAAASVVASPAKVVLADSVVTAPAPAAGASPRAEAAPRLFPVRSTSPGGGASPRPAPARQQLTGASPGRSWRWGGMPAASTSPPVTRAASPLFGTPLRPTSFGEGETSPRGRTWRWVAASPRSSPRPVGPASSPRPVAPRPQELPAVAFQGGQVVRSTSPGMAPRALSFTQDGGAAPQKVQLAGPMLSQEQLTQQLSALLSQSLALLPPQPMPQPVLQPVPQPALAQAAPAASPPAGGRNYRLNTPPRIRMSPGETVPTNSFTANGATRQTSPDLRRKYRPGIEGTPQEKRRIPESSLRRQYQV